MYSKIILIWNSETLPPLPRFGWPNNFRIIIITTYDICFRGYRQHNHLYKYTKIKIYTNTQKYKNTVWIFRGPSEDPRDRNRQDGETRKLHWTKLHGGKRWSGVNICICFCICICFLFVFLFVFVFVSVFVKRGRSIELNCTVESGDQVWTFVLLCLELYLYLSLFLHLCLYLYLFLYLCLYFYLCLCLWNEEAPLN